MRHGQIGHALALFGIRFLAGNQDNDLVALMLGQERHGGHHVQPILVRRRAGIAADHEATAQALG
ncbi:hypothetical protein D3C87_1953880 [compost metagenome]